MTWDELLKSLSNGEMPKVKYGDLIGTVTTIKNKGKYKGIAVDFGYNWDDWFHAETKDDKRSKYMEELMLIRD